MTKAEFLVSSVTAKHNCLIEKCQDYSGKDSSRTKMFITYQISSNLRCERVSGDCLLNCKMTSDPFLRSLAENGPVVVSQPNKSPG